MNNLLVEILEKTNIKYDEIGDKIKELSCNLKCLKNNDEIFYKNILKAKFSFAKNTSELIYLLYNDLESRPLCPYCKINELKYDNFIKGYRNHCSTKCSNNDFNIKNKKENTLLKNYGVINPNYSEEIINNKKNNCLHKYGVDHYSKTDEFKEKYKNVMQQNYGVDHYSKTSKFKEKIKNTSQKKWRVDSPLSSPEIQSKIKETNLERYGYVNPFQNEKIKNKIKQTNLKRYGVEYYTQTKKYSDKSKKTCLNKYGVKYTLQSTEIRNKGKNSLIKKYGVDNIFKSEIFKENNKNRNLKLYGVKNYSETDECKEKQRNKCIEKYGVNSYPETNEFKNILKKKSFTRFYNKLLTSDRLKNKVIPLFTLDDYCGSDNKYPWKCNVCFKEFEDNINNGRIPKCTNCYPKLYGASKGEKEVVEFCKQYYPDLIENDRTQISPLELDIYIPEINLAIEYNGLYWHSESQGKNKSYHLNKYLECKKQGIKLIQIFEDEWFDKEEIIKSILLNKFGKTINKIYARKCEIKEVNNEDSLNFLDDNHLQGSINSKINIGLFYNDELVSLLTFGKSRFNKEYEYEIHRFCNKINYNIPGSLSKLFKYFKDKYLPNNIITYSDLRYGEGNSYTNLGFKFKNISNPNYYYTNDYISKYSRLKFQKHKLKNLLENYDEELTEWQNMQLNNYDRIFDCGNNVFEWIKK